MHMQHHTIQIFLLLKLGILGIQVIRIFKSLDLHKQNSN
jgi:hypothetical protein